MEGVFRSSAGDILPHGSRLRRFVCRYRDLGISCPGDDDSDAWDDDLMEVYRDSIRNVCIVVPPDLPEVPDQNPFVAPLFATSQDFEGDGSRIGNLVRVLGIHLSYRAYLNLTVDTTMTEAPPGNFEGKENMEFGQTLRIMLIVSQFQTPDHPVLNVGDFMFPPYNYGIFGQTSNTEPHFEGCERCIFDRRICIQPGGNSFVNEQHFIDCDFECYFLDNYNYPTKNRVTLLIWANAEQRPFGYELSMTNFLANFYYVISKE